MIKKLTVSLAMVATMFTLTACRTAAPAVSTRYLQALSRGIPAPESNGTESMSDLSASGTPTAATSATGYQLLRHATFAQAFGSLGDTRPKWKTPSQVSAFCQANPTELGSHVTAHFFEMEDGTVLGVDVYGGQSLFVVVYRFGLDQKWDANYGYRFFVPEQ